MQQALNLPALALPVSGYRCLLAWWVDRLDQAGCREVHVIVNDRADAEQLRQLLPPMDGTGPSVEIEPEAGRWRGTAGLLHDVTRSWGTTMPLLAIEGACLPPPDLDHLTRPVRAEGDLAWVGLCSNRRPVGLTLLDAAALAQVPSIGFYDMKEQLLPALYSAGCGARAVQLEHPGGRVRDRLSYLAAIRRGEETMVCGATDRGRWRAGACLVHPDAQVDPSAVIHESIVLAGATIGAGAVLSRAIIGPEVTIAPDEVVRDRVATLRHWARVENAG